MLSHGADSFWYWDAGAFVFAGDKTAVSVSGREYKTDNQTIFLSHFLDFPCFPCSKSWRMTRFNLSSALWVLVSEKCTSTK